MNQKIRTFAVGIAIGAICTGGAVYAKSSMQSIEVMYDNIKVYKDNVLCELKDSNGTVIEPFIRKFRSSVHFMRRKGELGTSRRKGCIFCITV